VPRCLTLNECDARKREHLIAQAEAIFFAASSTKSFSSDEEKNRFCTRWFKRYADLQPEVFVFAVGEKEQVSGYLAGCIDSFRDCGQSIIADIDYFTPEFRAALVDYPSHLHVNVDPAHQGQGAGRLLFAKFNYLCRHAGSPGMHIVTGAASRAVKFYEACGFRHFPRGETACAGNAVMVYPLW
jgi:GNAT superfamily N-acetyltransferase